MCCLLASVLCVLALHVCVSGRSDRVLLRDVSAITLNSKSVAASKKGYYIQQLQCKGGSAYSSPNFYPKTVQCYNRGYDGYDVQWECKANLDKMVEFGHIDVNCEGYDHPDDKYILRGSCALRYDLNWRSQKHIHKQNNKTIFDGNSEIIFVVALVLAAFAIWYFCVGSVNSRSEYIEPVGDSTNQNSHYPSYPPPGYSEATRNRFQQQSGEFYSEPSAPWEYGCNANFGNSSSSPRRYHKIPDDTAYGLSGLAAGAGFLGGYYMGSRSQTNNQAHTYMNTDASHFADSTRTRLDTHNSSSNSSTRSCSPSSHVSSAFASTSRR